MSEKTFTRKITRIAAYILGTLIVLLVAFHFWFIHHAKGLIEDMVRDRSNGKLALKIDKFKFNWFSRKIELRRAVFYSTDTVNGTTAYRFKVDRLKIQVKKILPLVFDKKFYIDSIDVVNPEITVTKLRSKDSSAVKDTAMSIPQEMGHIYNSIQDALSVLQVDRFQIENGTFTLIDKTEPQEKPIVISRLNFHLDNLQVDSSQVDVHKKILFSDNVALSTTHQDILFPDGRHRLSFSSFHINILNRLAEFDSCTIIATKEDSSNNSFRIFFDKLRMTNIDFDTLYHTEVIKADSVYCINPRFRLDVDLPKRTGPIKPPKLDELIQQLTGNMALGFVVVQNASFDINTVREGRPSSFTSDHNNFELQGLKIQERATRPLTVERFAMAIRNYENFLRDSAYAIQFDSILINNNRISLSNFSYQELKDNKPVNTLMMPQFELQGLSWDNLVFDQQLNAERLTLIDPVINYNITKGRNKTSKDVVQALSDIGNIFQLTHLDIINGQVSLFFSKNTELHLEGATMSVAGEQLVDSKKIRDLQRSISELHFRKGFFKSGSLLANLDNVQFKGANNGLTAGSVYLDDKKSISATIHNVSFNSLNIDDKSLQVIVRDLKWQDADVKLSAFAGNGHSSTRFIFNGIHGAKTHITGDDGTRKLSAYLETVSADAFHLSKNEPLVLTGLIAKGTGINISDNQSAIQIGSFDIIDKRASALKNISYKSYKSGDSVSVTIPSARLTPDITAMTQGKLYVDAVTITQPDIAINLSTAASSFAKSKIQDIHISSLNILQPMLHFTNVNEKGETVLKWDGNTNSNSLELTNLQVNAGAIKADQLRLSLDHFLYTTAKGKTFNAGDGKLSLQLNQLALHKNETDDWDWQGTVTNLAAQNFIIDSLGKQDGKLTIATAKLNDLSVSSSYLLDMRELVSHNTRFNLQEVTGSYHGTEDQFDWYNASYDKQKKFFSVDSFSYHPTPGREEFVKSQKYQSDYITGSTGKISMGPFDILRFSKDTILDLGSLTIEGGRMTDYRDKRVPREPGSIRSLPVNLLKEISTHLLADNVTLKDAHVEYEEVNEATGKPGKVIIENLNANIHHLRNFNLSKTDSLEVRVSGYLQGKLFTQLHLKESYTDSLASFLLTAQMGPADLTILNPVLLPLASAQLKSGVIDTMWMRIVGNEYHAFGDMNMYYHDLKIRIGKARADNKRSFLSGIASFLANTLIKNSNKSRTAAVFFERLRDRSAINYLVKIALNGMSSSLGVKKNKKQTRKHADEIKSHPLPPME